MNKCNYNMKDGWYCTCSQGHSGPCALLPNECQHSATIYAVEKLVQFMHDVATYGIDKPSIEITPQGRIGIFWNRNNQFVKITFSNVKDGKDYIYDRIGSCSEMCYYTSLENAIGRIVQVA